MVTFEEILFVNCVASVKRWRDVHPTVHTIVVLITEEYRTVQYWREMICLLVCRWRKISINIVCIGSGVEP